LGGPGAWRRKEGREISSKTADNIPEEPTKFEPETLDFYSLEEPRTPETL